MKKTLAIILAFVLLVLPLASCNKAPRIQDEDWKLVSVYENDTKIEMNGVLTAEGGEITFTDTTGGVIYVGTYSDRDEFSPTAADYRIVIERAKGRAVVAKGEDAKGEKALSLTLIIGDYTLEFAPLEEEK